MSLAAASTACGAAPVQPLGAPQMAKPTGTSVNQLPINQRFGNLDEYLAYLEKMNGPIDKPWYRRVRPGIYELQTGNFRPLGGNPARRLFTRDELKKKFGFAK